MDTKQYSKVGKGKDENQVCSKCQSVLEERESQAEESKRLEEEHTKGNISGPLMRFLKRN